MTITRRVLLVQLPIPPVGPEPIRGNVPLAGGYLKMYAERHGLAADYQIDILPTAAANTLGDRGLVQEILAAEPWMVGFTCYLWNIQRTLWIAARLKEARPELLILLGGPEITADNDWVLRTKPSISPPSAKENRRFAICCKPCGRTEGDRPEVAKPIPGLFVRQDSEGPRSVPAAAAQATGKSGPDFVAVSWPAFSTRPMNRCCCLETIRGCIFKCKFCYYPKSYDSLYFLSEEKIVANLEHARRRGRAKSCCSIRRSISAAIFPRF